MKINKILSFLLGAFVLVTFSASHLFAAAQAPKDNSIKYELVEEKPTLNLNSDSSNLAQKSGGAYAGGRTIKVRYGDTLWSIARANRPYKTTTKQVMLATLELNPNAFFMNNVNGLLKNTRLHLPNYKQSRKYTAGRADVEVAKQNRIWADYQAREGKGGKNSGKFASPSKSYSSKSFFSSSFDKKTSVSEQLAAAKKKEAILQNQIAKMEKIIKQKDLTIKKMKAKGGASASSALFKGVEDYTPLSGEAMKANWPWFVAGGFLLFMLFLILRWKRKSVYAGGTKGGKGGTSRAQKKQAAQKAKQAQKEAKLAEKEAKKQAKIDQKQAAKDAKLKQKQSKQASKDAKKEAKLEKNQPKKQDFDVARAKAMQELEKDFNLPPSQDLAIDAVLDTKVSKKKPEPLSTKTEDLWEEDTFAELDDLELDFDFDDDLDSDLLKKTDARADKNQKVVLSDSDVEQKLSADKTFDLENNQLDFSEKIELEPEQLQSIENLNDEFILSEEDLKPLEEVEFLDADLDRIISETEEEFSKKATGALEDSFAELSDLASQKATGALEDSFVELSDLNSKNASTADLASEVDAKGLDFSELESADTDFENISTEEDFLSEFEADKLEREFLQEADLAKDADLDLELLNSSTSASPVFEIEIQDEDQEISEKDLSASPVLNKNQKIDEEQMPFFELRDFNDLLHGVIANPEFIECDEETKNLFSKITLNSEKASEATQEINSASENDAFTALEAMGGFDALGDIYDYTYNSPMRASVLDEEQLTAWRTIRNEERREEKDSRKVGGLKLNSKSIEFDKFYDTPQLHRLEELLQTKEIKEFEEYFSSDDEFDQIVENVKEDFLLDLTDFSEVPEFKEIEELDLDGLNEAIDLAESQVADKEELENMLKDADQLEYESFFTDNDDTELNTHQEPKVKTTEETFLADLSDFNELEQFSILEEDSQAQAEDSQALEQLHKDFIGLQSDEQKSAISDGLDKLENLENADNLENLKLDPQGTQNLDEPENSDELKSLDSDLDLDYSTLNKLVDKDISNEEDLDDQLLAEVTNFAQTKSESLENKVDFVDNFDDDPISGLNFDTKLNLAAAYIAIGDFSEAAEILKLVAQKGNSQQQAKAIELGERENLHI